MSISSDFNRLHTELAQAVVACRADHDRHSVHSVRTGTRKLEAVLTKGVEDHPGATRLHKRSKRALRELKLIRKAAGPVRDLDVHRKLAEELRAPADGAGTRATGNTASEHRQLDRALKHRRKQAAKKLAKILKKSEVRLEAVLADVAKAMEHLTAEEPPPLTTAREWARASSPPEYDPTDDSFDEKLHGYRKQTKAARYVAGLQETSAPARRLAKKLKEMQDSIGRWHDLMLLTGEAGKILGKRSRLADAIRQECERARDEATRHLKLRPDVGAHA